MYCLLFVGLFSNIAIYNDWHIASMPDYRSRFIITLPNLLERKVFLVYFIIGIRLSDSIGVNTSINLGVEVKERFLGLIIKTIDPYTVRLPWSYL